MIFTGKVFERVDSFLGNLEVEKLQSCLMVKLNCAGSEILKFPLPVTADSNEIIRRTQSILNQTGFINSSARVELTEVT